MPPERQDAVNFSQLETLIAVADAGSFLQASTTLGVSPQSLMQQVGVIERELGCAVLHRDNRGVTPTQAGEAFIAQERAVLAAHRNAIEQARAAASRATTLRLGIPSGVNPAFLLQVCEQFAREHPQTRVLHVAHKRSQMPEAFMNGEVDLYMDIGLTSHMAGQPVALFEVRHYCVMGRDDTLTAFDRIEPCHLKDRVIGVWESPDRYTTLANELGLPSVNSLRNLHRDISAAIALCMGGGVLITSIPVVEMLKSTLAVVPLAFDCQIDYAAVRGSDPNPLVDAFIACARALADSPSNPWTHSQQALGCKEC